MPLLFRYEHPESLLLDSAALPSLAQEMKPVAPFTQFESLKRPHESRANELRKIR